MMTNEDEGGAIEEVPSKPLVKFMTITGGLAIVFGIIIAALFRDYSNAWEIGSATTFVGFVLLFLND